jgi:hypothetical protein
MDIEFHYYINYIVATKAGFFPDIAHKIAYSAQYIDDNSDEYTILEKGSLTQYNNIVTQSLNPTLNFKEILSIFPVFHFIPGDDILRSSSLRRDGLFRHMSTTPDCKLARNCLKTAIKNKDPYWIGIASHAYADTWAHQNFTGLKDQYNAVEKHNCNNSRLLKLDSCIGHTDVLHLPDSPSSVWYDYRLKEMKVNNCERFLDAAKNLFKMYLKYGDQTMFFNRPKRPEIAWNDLKSTLHSIFTNEFIYLEKILGKNCGSDSNTRFLIMKILGMNRAQRVEIYQNLAEKYETEVGLTQTYCKKYDKNQWLNNAIYSRSNSENNYDNHAANDNKIESKQLCSDVLCDSGQATYGCSLGSTIKDKISSILKIYKKVYIWHDNYRLSDWYKFQESAKKHHDYMISKVIRIAKKDMTFMKEKMLL